MKFWMMFFLALFVASPGVAMDDVAADEDEFYEEEYEDVAEEYDYSSSAVVERVSCSDVQAKVYELSGKVASDAGLQQQLEYWKNEYRTKCSHGAGARLTTTDVRMSVFVAGDEVPVDTNLDEYITEDETDVTESVSAININPRTRQIGARVAPVKKSAQSVKTDVVVETEEVAEAEIVEEDIKPELTPEQELANLDAGLCADGSQPNKFGCCTGEIFKDLGDMVFACCLDEGDCFPPIEK